MKNKFDSGTSSTIVKGVLITIFIVILGIVTLGIFTQCSDPTPQADKTLEVPGLPEFVGHSSAQIKYWKSLNKETATMVDTDSLLKYSNTAISGFYENYFIKDYYCYMAQINIVVQNNKEGETWIKMMSGVMEARHYTDIIFKDEGLMIVQRTDNHDKLCLVLMFKDDKSTRGVLSWSFYNRDSKVDPDKLSRMLKF